jgi:hypothetical protein
MSIPDEESDIECPHCGAMAPAELTRCPRCGLSFYPEDEPSVASSQRQPAARASLYQRIISLLVICALVGGGFSLLIGMSWVWLALAGVVALVVFGLWDWLKDRLS